MITEESTLEEIIRQLDLQERAYRINPADVCLEEIVEEGHTKEYIISANGTKKLKQLKLKELPMVAKDWNLTSIVEGLQYLEEKMAEGQVFYEIGTEEQIITDVFCPDLVAFPLEKTSKFVLICPGGGYSNVCSIAEGYPLAKELNRLGYAAFVLHYSTGKYAGNQQPQKDAAKALQYILEHSEEFRVDPEHFAVMGFSAGGHLVASMATKNIGFVHYSSCFCMAMCRRLSGAHSKFTVIGGITQ